jgi:hypothetical protein
MLHYNVETEVSKKQYDILRTEFSGIVAHREDNGKYYILLWLSRYRKQVERVLGERG